MYTNMWKLNDTLKNKYKEIAREIRKHLKMNENENITHQNLGDESKVVFRRKFIAAIAYI